VVLTYDDALASQLDNAVPVLDHAGFKGTFFLGNVHREHVARWRAVAARGHELANHTVFHACAAKQFPADPRYTAEAYTPASMVREIEQQNVLLTALDGRAEHGFGVPCGTTIAGGQDYLPALRAAKIVSYVRGRGTGSEDVRVDVSTMDPFAVPARDFPEGTTGTQLIDFAQSAQAGGGMAVFVFHGDYLQTSLAAHRELVDWFKVHRRDVWVARLDEVLAWAKAHPGTER
jgi:peptidoglycan/xylan/chitin deacetylase (PgdA/CDA1 family)